MQVAINPTLYSNARVYAEKRGMNINNVIEDFLTKFLSSVSESGDGRKSVRSKNISPRVASLLTGHSWTVADEEMKHMRYEYLMEKYK